MVEPELAIAASPREWAQRLHRHVADHGGARVRVTALQRQDVLDEAVDVLVADDTTSFLSAQLVAELHTRGGLLLGVYDGDAPTGKGELLELGADDVVERGAGPEEFLRVITALVRTRPLPERVPVASAPLPVGPLPEDTVGPGHLTAVAGCGGGTGATEVAVGLALAVARAGAHPVLVDVDEVAPSVAQRLGLRLYPNLRAAVDVVEQRTGDLLATLTPAVSGRLAVLVGLSHGRDWNHVRPGEVVDVLARLRAVATHVVANAGPLVEDTRAEGGQRRFGQTRAVVSAADTIVGVGLATPVGLTRVLEWVAAVRTLNGPAPLHLVLNRAPAGAFQRREIEAELQRTFAPASLTLLPPDPRVPAAAWAGRAVEDGPFRRGVAALAATALPAAPAAAVHRRRAGGVRRRGALR